MSPYLHLSVLIICLEHILHVTIKHIILLMAIKYIKTAEKYMKLLSLGKNIYLLKVNFVIVLVWFVLYCNFVLLLFPLWKGLRFLIGQWGETESQYVALSSLEHTDVFKFTKKNLPLPLKCQG